MEVLDLVMFYMNNESSLFGLKEWISPARRSSDLSTSISATCFLDLASVWWLQWKLCISRPFMSKWAHVWVGAWMRCIVGKVNGAADFSFSRSHDGYRQKAGEREREERRDRHFALSFTSVRLSLFKQPTIFWSHKSVKLTVTPATKQHARWICARDIMTAFHTVPDHFMQY